MASYSYCRYPELLKRTTLQSILAQNFLWGEAPMSFGRVKITQEIAQPLAHFICCRTFVMINRDENERDENKTLSRIRDRINEDHISRPPPGLESLTQGFNGFCLYSDYRTKTDETPLIETHPHINASIEDRNHWISQLKVAVKQSYLKYGFSLNEALVAVETNRAIKALCRLTFNTCQHSSQLTLSRFIAYLDTWIENTVNAGTDTFLNFLNNTQAGYSVIHQTFQAARSEEANLHERQEMAMQFRL